MATISTFKVLFYIQKGKSRADGQAPIIARITVNGEFSTLTTKTYILPDRWLTKENRTAGATREEKEINSILDAYRILITARYNEMLLRGEVVTSEKVKQAALNLEDKKCMKLLELCDKFIEDYYQFVVTESVTHCTYQRYVLTRERLANI